MWLFNQHNLWLKQTFLLLLFTGFFKADNSFDVCEKCPDGYFQDKIGQTTCNKCPERYFCPVSGA